MDGDNDCNEPPLTAAVAAGRKDVVTLLLDKGADVNKTDYSTAAAPSIHLAASAEMIDLLVDRGADVLARDGLGNSAIVSALVRGL